MTCVELFCFFRPSRTEWRRQKKEFEKFNRPILMTSNCVGPPADSCKDRLWTTGETGVPSFGRIPGACGETKDFSAIIEQAKHCALPTELETGSIVGGFAHEQVFALVDRVVDAVKTDAISKFVAIGGCDGRQKSRAYYVEFAEKQPKDTVILTAGCAKHKYTVARHAVSLYGCTGWVRNEWDGSVTMEIQGTQENIDKVILAIERGSYVRIANMDIFAYNVPC